MLIMYWKALPLFSFPVMVLTACSSSKKVADEKEPKLKTNYLASVVIDGKDDEWVSVPLEFNPNGSFEYAVANTDNELCIFLKVASQVEQTKLLHGGMEIWINGPGNKEKKTGVFYPVKGELSEEERPQMIQGQKQDVKEMRLRMAGQLISLNRVGFKPEFNGVQSIRQETGFKAAINWDNNDDLIYELAVPFAALPENLRNHSIELGFYINGMDRPKNNTASAGNGSEGREGGGRMGGGRMGGGHMGGRGFDPTAGGRQARSQRQQATSQYNQWQKVYVAESFWAEYSTK
jgi:hypothetical protein